MRICVLFVTAAVVLFSQDNLGVLPEGPGLAAKHAGDSGIADNPSVVFVEDFKSGVLEELRARWSDISNRQGKVLGKRRSVGSLEKLVNCCIKIEPFSRITL